MLTSKPNTLRRVVACGLALTMLCPPSGGLLLAAQAQSPMTGSSMAGRAAAIKSVLLFPFTNNVPATANTGGASLDDVSARLEDAIKLKLNVVGRFRATSYSRTLASVQRGLDEPKGLTQDDITPPFDDPQKAGKIAGQVATDGYLTGTIESLKNDPATRKVSLTVTAGLYDTQTGAAVKTMALTGYGISYNAADNPDMILQTAIDDAAGKIVSSLNALRNDKVITTVPESQRGHSNVGPTILIALLIGAAVYGLSHRGGGGSSSSGTAPTTTPAPTDTGGPPAPPTVR